MRHTRLVTSHRVVLLAIAATFGAGSASFAAGTGSWSPVSAFDRPATDSHRWSGFYGGLSAGYTWGEATQFYEREGDHGTTSLSPEGFAGSLTAGYGMQWPSGLVLGVEADLGLMDVSAGPETVFDGHVYSAEFGSFWGTLRGRLGLAMGDLLLYGTGGLAFMDVSEVSIGNTPGETAISEDLRTGWVVGAGIEQALTQETSIKLEYLHMDFGSNEGRSDNNERFAFDETADLLRVGLNYRF